MAATTPPDHDLPPDDPEASSAGPSRLGIVVTIAIALTITIVTAISLTGAPTRQLADEEVLLEPGMHELVFGSARLEVALSGGWVARHRCARWLQLAAADNDGTTLHLVWLDAVPTRSLDGDILMEPAPDDVIAWLGERSMVLSDPEPVELVGGATGWRGDLAATDGIHDDDALMSCGDVPGAAGTGMLGPQAGFLQHVAVVDTAGAPVLVVGAAWTGGDFTVAVAAVDEALAGRLSIVDPAEDDPV